MKRIKVYKNNIYSPSRLLLHEAFYGNCSSDSFLVDTVSCCKLLTDVVSCGGIMLNAFQVEFWDEIIEDVRPILRVVIHAPAMCSAELFLRYLEKALMNSQVLSLIHGYWIDGVEFPYGTINTLHHYFKSKEVMQN
jgi:hypothetical protein